jgi:drug/metabolite transporter (DMT)-like permease
VLAVVFAFASSLCWGTADFMGGLQSRRRPLLTVLTIGQLAAMTLAIGYVAIGRGTVPGLGPAAAAFAAGVTGCMALAAFYRGLAIGTMSIVAPVSATGAAVPVLAGLAQGERPATLQVAGIAVALMGIVLAAREPATAEPGKAVRASLGLALLAALGFGMFFWLIDAATASGGVPWTILFVRAGELVLLGAVFAVRRPALPTGLRDAAPLLLIGSLDMLANVMFALATTHGLLSVVSVVGSLYPAVTVVLARLVLSERVSRSQELGVLATLAGVVAISAG